ncbi:MAG: signal peptidase I [Candidatus Omnitrophota bacterium]
MMKKVIIIVLLVGIIVLLAGIVPFYIRNNIAQGFKIPSDAMKPTIIIGDRVLVDKAIYKNSEPKRGDIVVFKYPGDPSKQFIKRVAGLPNETIEIKEGLILINDNVIQEPAIFTSLRYFNRGEYGQKGKPIKIPNGSYFVLGDNSAASRDSRYWGFVPRENIIGKASKIYYPSNRAGEIK